MIINIHEVNAGVRYYKSAWQGHLINYKCIMHYRRLHVALKNCWIAFEMLSEVFVLDSVEQQEI